MKVRSILLLAFCLQAPALYAQDEAAAPAMPEATADCEETITVFQDVSGMGRKDRAAKNMTARHAEMARQGWRYADMEIYTENGDLEGFYLTYTRAAACPPAAPDEG